MAKIGRNDPCPCGSGKKYKRCCLAALANPEPTRAAVGLADSPERDHDLCDCCLEALNERADRALDLILDGHLDEAEAMAHDLMRDFPKEVEGVDLLSMVSEARGQQQRAAELLRHAIDIVRVHPHHDVETRLLMRQRLRQLEQPA
jgi:predicted Zn-dependent protease